MGKGCFGLVVLPLLFLAFNNCQNSNALGGSVASKDSAVLTVDDTTLLPPPAPPPPHVPKVAANAYAAPVPSDALVGKAYVMNIHATSNRLVLSLAGDVKGLRYFFDDSGFVDIPGPYFAIITLDLSFPVGTSLVCAQALGTDGQWRGAYQGDPEQCNEVPSKNFPVHPGVNCSPIIPLHLTNNFTEFGFAIAISSDFGTPADISNQVAVSRVKLYEDGVEMGPAHSPHANIRNIGLGRYSHYSGADGSGETLRFAATDNSDPRTNGRKYTFCIGSAP